MRPALTTAPVVRGLDTDHDLRRGQRCIFLNRPVSLINRGKPVQINRATSHQQTRTIIKHQRVNNGNERIITLQLLDYGFVYHRDPNFSQDDTKWFLLEQKNGG